MIVSTSTARCITSSNNSALHAKASFFFCLCSCIIPPISTLVQDARYIDLVALVLMDVELILAMNGLAMRRDWTIENLITQLACESSLSLMGVGMEL